MHIKLPLTAMSEFNMEHNETMLCMWGCRRQREGGKGKERGKEGGRIGRRRGRVNVYEDFLVHESALM